MKDTELIHLLSVLRRQRSQADDARFWEPKREFPVKLWIRVLAEAIKPTRPDRVRNMAQKLAREGELEEALALGFRTTLVDRLRGMGLDSAERVKGGIRISDQDAEFILRLSRTGRVR